MANDQKVLNKLVILSDRTIIKRDYVVKVTDRELTQVIYTSGVRVQRDPSTHNHWIWNGFLVEKIADQ